MTRLTIFCALAFIAALPPGLTLAQDAPAFRSRQLIVSGGAAITGGYPIGDMTVTIPRNPGGTPPFTLLTARSEIARASGIDVRVAFALSPTWAIEVGGAYATPQLGVTIAQDPELAAGAFASEQIRQYGVEVSGIYQLPLGLGRRARAYAIGGGGYLRQLHEGRLLVETGTTFHVGGGLQYWLRGMSGQERAIGLRAEARYARRNGGVEFEERSRSYAQVSALAFLAF